jgi:hypothetical protein
MRTTIIALLSLAAAAAAFAQWEPPGAPQMNDHGGEPRVYYAHGFDRAHPNLAGLDDRVSLHVQNLSTLLKQVNGNCSNILLFIDSMPIKGMQPESCDDKLGRIRYLLRRTDQSDETWHKLLGSPHHYARPVSLSIGPDGQFSVRTDVVNFMLEAVPRFWFLLFIGVAFVFVALVTLLCTRTSIIRSGSESQPVRERPYSLSLFQMAFWFGLVMIAYVFIWLINDELDTITGSVLALIGIGAGTAISASLIDKNKAEGAAADCIPAKKSQGFIHDVISDADGVSLHRFQMFIWTLVLGVIFIASVYKNLSMPEFSATLLGLMGISSGTYVGFKTQEKTAADAPAGTTDVAPPSP